MDRRGFLAASAAAGLVPAWVRAAAPAAAGPKVVVVGAGFGGATVAKYLRLWGPNVQVTLVERDERFLCCPMSNRVLAGTMSMHDLERDYDALRNRYAIRVVRDTVTDIDAAAREVRLATGARLPYDRLVVAPGIDYWYERLPGMASAAAQDQVLHAWKAGPQTVALRRRIQAMPKGGVFAMHIPAMPYRCPPGPYERATMVAYYLKRANPTGKVLVFDSNPDVVAKKELFRAVFDRLYKGAIEYVPNAELKEVDAAGQALHFEFQGKVRADLLNVIPPQRAGVLARRAGLADDGDRWCGVDFLSYESRVAKNVHLVGDSIAAAPGMPKSGHMANQQAKVCAAAVVALLNGQPVVDDPIVTNTCYSFVNDKDVVHVSSVHRYDREKKTMLPVPGAGGVSREPSAEEGFMALAWAYNIMNDMFA
jgi:NADPH-dependent 2,4-dienoyl-CoA reductase/sulfur reductase-like enzyme